MASMPFLPSEVIEKVVESMMWALQNERLEGEEGGAVGATRKAPRSYAAIPLVSRSFRDAYLRFFTTLPALSYDTIRAPWEVRLFRRSPSRPSPSATQEVETTPYIVAAPGVVEMLAANGRLGHLKWVHITTATLHNHIGWRYKVVGTSPLESLYQLLDVHGHGHGDRHGVPLALEEARVELCSKAKVLDIAFHRHFLKITGHTEWALLNALGLNATSLHIGFTAKFIRAAPNSTILGLALVAATPFVSSHKDFSRITRLTLSSKAQHMVPSKEEDWAPLINRVLEGCSECRELCWELTEESELPWGCSTLMRHMAELVLPNIKKSSASVLIHCYFALITKDEPRRRLFFLREQQVFRLGRLVAEVGTMVSGEMTREIVFFTGAVLNGVESSGVEEEEGEKKAGENLNLTNADGEEGQEEARRGRRVVRWNVKYY